MSNINSAQGAGFFYRETIHARVPSGDGFPSEESNTPLKNAMNNPKLYQ